MKGLFYKNYMSKYQNIYKDLLDKIKNGKIAEYSYLPSERELMEMYNVSRDTVRKALQLLLENGYIQKNKGKGSLVLDINRIEFPVSGVTSFKELQKKLDKKVETIVSVFEEVQICNKLKPHLNMKDGLIYHIERVRKIDNEKIILDIDYINKSIIPNLTEVDAKNSLYEYIEKKLKLKVGFAKKEITVKKATDREKELLDMNEYDLLVCIRSYVYLDDATLFQYTISKHRPDKFRFVDFAKRREL